MAESEAPSATVQETVELVMAAQTGDQEALSELISLHLRLVYNVVGRNLPGHADVDDIVQETMLRVMRGLPGLREPDRFRSWVIAIAYRQVQQYLRTRQKASQGREDIRPEHPDPGADFAERTVTELVLAQQRRELTEAARWLDEDDQRLLSLWWQERLRTLTRTELAVVWG